MFPLITIDYELFGNGTGDIIKTIVEPMDRIKKICDRYRTKITIFFEFAEYLTMKELAEKDTVFEKKLKLLQNQIRTLKEEGHDIQLHFHPQFISAYYNGTKFIVNESAFTIEGFLKGMDLTKARNQLGFIIDLGISEIKELVNDNSYKIIAFRAGGWNLTPGNIIIPILKEKGIRIDSSGVKGAIMKSNRHSYDYRIMVDRIGYWWTSSDSINQIGLNGQNLIEVPIYSSHYFPIDPRKFYLLKMGTQLIAKHEKDYTLPDVIDIKTIYYAMISDIKWDFCKLNAREMWNFYREGFAMDKKDSIKTMVMIGHTKDYNNDINFDYFLRKVQLKGDKFYTFLNINEIIN